MTARPFYQGPMQIEALDHLVLTVADIEATAAFYTGALGMTREDFRPADGSTRTALKFGRQKINLHQAGAEFDPKARAPAPGTADLCFLISGGLAPWVARLKASNIPIEEGPIRRTGATGPILSIYLRDPDGNLIELSEPL